MPEPHKEQQPDESSIVTITIPSGKKFTVHAHLLAQHSEYFRRALNSQFQEAKTLKFDLVEHATEKIVSNFVNWIYTVSSATFVERTWLEYYVFPEMDFKDLVHSWLFGEYLQAKEFQLSIVYFLAEWGHRDLGSVADLWDAVPPNSGIRRVMVELFCQGCVRDGEEKTSPQLENLPMTMLQEVSKRLVTGLKKAIEASGTEAPRFSEFDLDPEKYR
ncbi:hypothetical protein F4811DRAFT_548606 [Daldinia bambusicola]|nr:hypothetical protein F4811DRAFT_548606 [Daldinia bambusicola]